jgi:hypothetical protein
MRTALLVLLFAVPTAYAQAPPDPSPSLRQRLIVGGAATAGGIVGAYMGIEIGSAVCGYGPSCEGFMPAEAVSGAMVGLAVGSALFAYGAELQVNGQGSVLLATAGALLGGVGAAGFLSTVDPTGFGIVIGGLAGGIGGGALGYGAAVGGRPGRRAILLHPATGPDGGAGMVARIAL